MASTDELQTAVRETLESRGVMSQLKAQIRAEVFKALDDHQREGKTQFPEENLVINKLIKDYLLFNGYNYTCSVFLKEAGEPVEELSTEFIAQEMSLSTSAQQCSVPLLYQMVDHFKSKATTTVASPTCKPHPPDDTSLVNPDPCPTTHHHGNQVTSATNENASHPPTVVMKGLKLS